MRVARHRVPTTLMPVLDSMLAEMGGLGFIGLFLEVVVTGGGPVGDIVAGLSEEFLGDEEILLETFEFLHSSFFEVGVGFFLVASLTVTKVLQKLESLNDVSQDIFANDASGNGCLQQLATALQVENITVDFTDEITARTEQRMLQVAKTTRKNDIWREVAMDTSMVKAEALVVRERLVQTNKVPKTFLIEDYYAKIFATNLKEIVELSPLTWLPLIPCISLGRSIDMSRDIVSAASPNAAEACGYFLASPTFLSLSFFTSGLAVVWSIANFWKMAQIKEMLMPMMLEQQDRQCAALLLPPKFRVDSILKEFNSSPSIVGLVEGIFVDRERHAPRNAQERLFGTAGSAGPDLYRNSIKCHTWLVVSQIVFWGGQIVARDLNVLFKGLPVGEGVNVPLECSVFGFFVVCAVVQLSLVPQTFLNYCLITSIEDMTQGNMLSELSVAES